MITLRSRRPIPQRSQHGNFMLEALIAILIVALGILGTVGLYARSVQTVEDSKYRSEAALLASTLVGEMWVSDTHSASLIAKYDSSGAGAGITEFKALVAQRLPSSTAPAPVVTVTPGATAGSSNVEITINWVHPGDAADPLLPPFRKYVVNATIGGNAP